jgi:hypothetical protein
MYLNMRIWSIHPQYLDWKGLGAQWRECLLAQKVIQGETKGWRNHPQLNRFKEHPEPQKATGFYLKEIHREASIRGYSYNYSKILEPVESVEKISITKGQLDYEFRILMERLEKRTPKRFEKNLNVKNILPHPLFQVIEGLPEKWEKSYWRNNTS